MPEGVTAEEVLTVFHHVAAAETFAFHRGDTRMGYAKFASKDDAVRVLIECHNQPLKGRNLKVSFAKQSL